MTRAQLIRVINVGRSKLGWDDDLYRATLGRFGGKPDAQGHVSLKSLDDLQMRTLLTHMRSAGFKAATGRPHNTEVPGRGDAIKKIEALLTDGGKPWAYAESILQTQTRGAKARIAFADGNELLAVIVALEKHNLKQLTSALNHALAHEGWSWDDGAFAAELLFGFRSRRRDLTRYSQMMSQLLRWLRGELAPFSTWPPSR